MFQCEKCSKVINETVCPYCGYNNTEYIKEFNINVNESFDNNSSDFSEHDYIIADDMGLGVLGGSLIKITNPNNKKMPVLENSSKDSGTDKKVVNLCKNEYQRKRLIIVIAVFAILLGLISVIMYNVQNREIYGIYKNFSSYNEFQEDYETIIINEDGTCMLIVEKNISELYGTWSKKDDTYIFNVGHTLYYAEFDDEGNLILETSSYSPFEEHRLFKKV